MSITDFGAQLAAAISNAGITTALTVTRSEIDPDSPPFDPTFVDVDYACQGWRDQYDAALIANSVVEASDVRVFILQSSLATVPAITDHITMSSVTYRVLAVSADPANATFELRCAV